MKRIDLHSSQGRYPILIGAGLLSSLGPLIRKYCGLPANSKVLIVSNRVVAKHYLGTAKRSFSKIIKNIRHCLLPFGDERDKSEKVLRYLWKQMVKAGLERTSCAVALGGGVVGDVTGFAASTYMRGIRVVQVPTTLLAQVDSAIGGKTAIDLLSAKNIIGSFHQPKLVVSDINTLGTLPIEDFRNSFAEVIKYAVIYDQKLFEIIDAYGEQFFKSLKKEKISRKDFSFLEIIIARSVRVKVDVVELDEFETKGKRMVLNYGHTFAHALESASGYKLPHGKAVAVGMILAAKLARRRGELNVKDEMKQHQLIRKMGLPVSITNGQISRKQVLSFMKRDKKVRQGKLRFVLPRRIGSAVVREGISDEEVNSVLNQILKLK
jgi:3-dehydroquinate synthase